MNEIILELISQFGISGIILVLVGYVAYDRYKLNTSKQAGEDDASLNRGLIKQVNDKIDSIQDHQKEFEEQTAEIRKAISNRLDKIENTLIKIKDPHPADMEAKVLTTLSERYPMIHKILGNAVDNIGCDHIAIAHVHNGMKGITGIPFIKASVVAERYDPVKNPHDIELGSRYQNEDLMRHDLLPASVIQKDYLCFEVYENSPLQEVDIFLHQRCLRRGIKSIAFHALKSHKGFIFGFLVCYSLTSKRLNESEIKQTAALLEEVYSL